MGKYSIYSYFEKKCAQDMKSSSLYDEFNQTAFSVWPTFPLEDKSDPFLKDPFQELPNNSEIKNSRQQVVSTKNCHHNIGQIILPPVQNLPKLDDKIFSQLIPFQIDNEFFYKEPFLRNLQLPTAFTSLPNNFACSVVPTFLITTTIKPATVTPKKKKAKYHPQKIPSQYSNYHQFLIKPPSAMFQENLFGTEFQIRDIFKQHKASISTQKYFSLDIPRKGKFSFGNFKRFSMSHSRTFINEDLFPKYYLKNSTPLKGPKKDILKAFQFPIKFGEYKIEPRTSFFCCKETSPFPELDSIAFFKSNAISTPLEPCFLKANSQIQGKSDFKNEIDDFISLTKGQVPVSNGLQVQPMIDSLISSSEKKLVFPLLFKLKEILNIYIDQRGYYEFSSVFLQLAPLNIKFLFLEDTACAKSCPVYHLTFDSCKKSLIIPLEILNRKESGEVLEIIYRHLTPNISSLIFLFEKGNSSLPKSHSIFLLKFTILIPVTSIRIFYADGDSLKNIFSALVAQAGNL